MIDLTVAFAVLVALGLLGRRWPRWEALGLAARPWARFARYAALADGVRSTATEWRLFLGRAEGCLELGEAASLVGAFASDLASDFRPSEALALLATVMVSVSCVSRSSAEWGI